MVICTLFDIRRQSSPMARRDKHGHPHPFCYPETIKSDGTQRQTWSSVPFLQSRDNQVRWHAETKHGYPHPFCYLETIESDGTQRQTWSSAPFFLFRDNQVQWHVETIKVICTLLAIQRQSSPMACGDHHGHPRPLCYPETIKSDGMQRPSWSFAFIVFETILVSFAI